MKKLLLNGVATAGLVAGLGFAASQPADAAVTWPGFGADTLGPALIITITNTGITTSNGPGAGQGPYDGVEDTYIGVVNESSHTVSTLGVVSSLQTIFGFDGDGIDTYGAPGNGTDHTGYGGPDTFFTGINGTDTSGTISFVTALAAGVGGVCNDSTPSTVGGCATFFSLEEPLSISSITVGPVPEPASFAILGAGLVGMAFLGRRRRKS